MRAMTFIEIYIRHRLSSLRILYATTLARFVQRQQFLDVNISEMVKAI